MTRPLRRGITPAAVAAIVALVASGCGDQSLPTPTKDGRPGVEVSTPPDAVATRGIVLLIHGGGWSGPLPKLTAGQRPAAKILNDEGFATVIVDYRSGRQSFDDVLYRIDQAHAAFPHQPMCLFGQSAGGHLALLAAAYRPAIIRCVVAHAAPTDLPALRKQAKGTPSYGWAVKAFGKDDLTKYSPVHWAARIRAKVLQINAKNDRYVPPAQATEFQRALPGSRLILLSKGSVPFLHSSVDANQLGKAATDQLTFIERAAR